MAILGPDLAIASVGISCQTSFQIDANLTLIEQLSGAKLERHATPFDDVLCPTIAAVQMIRDGIMFPRDPLELEYGPKPFWAKRGVHFWHWKGGDFARFLSRARHLDESWARIGDAKRRVFVISNTQSNIIRALIEAGREPIECRLKWKDVFQLFGALARRFGQVELHVVTRPERFRDLDSGGAVLLPWADGRIPITLHAMPRDGSAWAGDVRLWADVFRKMIP